MRYRIRSSLISITAGMLLGSGPALAASNACKADLNGDLVVNFADLAVMKSVFFQRSDCPSPTCGDDVAQGPTEECDDGNLTNWDGCSSTCQIERPGTTSGLEDRRLTVFDHATGLEWEKKSDDRGIHDKENRYTWSAGEPNWNPDGTAFTVFLAALNGGAALGVSADGLTSSGPCYASHCDWRLPTVSELNTIVDCSLGAPCVDPIFGPTQSNIYWSSSSFATDPYLAWVVCFECGLGGGTGYKTGFNYVRAVRGGL